MPGQGALHKKTSLLPTSGLAEPHEARQLVESPHLRRVHRHREHPNADGGFAQADRSGNHAAPAEGALALELPEEQ